MSGLSLDIRMTTAAGVFNRHTLSTVDSGQHLVARGSIGQPLKLGQK